MATIREFYEGLGEIPKQKPETIKSLKELVKFLQLGARTDLKAIAVDTVFSMSSVEDDGIWAILSIPELLISLISLIQDVDNNIAKNAASCLVNITSDKYGPRELLNLKVDYNVPLQTKPDDIVQECFKQVFDKYSIIADRCCMMLSNLSREKDAAEQTYELLEGSKYKIEDIVDVFSKVKFNESGADLDYLGPWFSNMTQVKRFRTKICGSVELVNKFLVYTTYTKSIVRRHGVVGALRNLCFDLDYQEWLLHETDILPRLLLPLAGNEEFDDEDNDTLPSDLQYLPDDKERENSPDIRKMLVEALTQLCTQKKNRTYIRDNGTYLILRELHKWEKDQQVQIVVENLVDILIRTEEEIGLDNLKEVEIPEDIVKKFSELDSNLENETQ